jgi:segregation and condensation protein A
MTRLNQYLDMVKRAKEGEHLSIDNPFDRSIYLAFDLVLNHDFNPWNIDLVPFSTLYLKRAREEQLDLMIAGRIIYMAWKVLRLQSDHLVIHMEAKKEEEHVFGWEDIPTGAWMESDDEYSYTNLVLTMEKPPLEEPVRRDAKRKITFIELLGAFDQARKDVEEYQLVETLRREERARRAVQARKAMKGATHEDHLEEDIVDVWKRIRGFSKNSMKLSDLMNTTDAEERIKTFLSVLFLAYDNKIRLSQRRFPYGEIYIKMIGYT